MWQPRTAVAHSIKQVLICTRLILCGNLVHTSRLHPRGNLVHTFSPRGNVHMLVALVATSCTPLSWYLYTHVMSLPLCGILVHTLLRLAVQFIFPMVSSYSWSWYPRTHGITSPLHTIPRGSSYTRPWYPRTHGLYG